MEQSPAKTTSGVLPSEPGSPCILLGGLRFGGHRWSATC
jgi:hypothetical protein